MRRHISHCPDRFHQGGYALLLMLVMVTMGILFTLVSQISEVGMKWARAQDGSAALSQAKEALIGEAASQPSLASAGYLLLPDLGFGPPGTTPMEGSSAGNPPSNAIDFSLIGKVPWKSLGISPLRDENGECPWYIVSGRFKKTPQTNAPFNWDTQGQIDIIDGNGSVIATNVVAMIVSPGSVLDGQNRALSDPAYVQCGGNYDVRNYLDTYDVINAVSSQRNYFVGSINNRLAPNANNKQFVMTDSGHYNDRFLYVTVDDIYRPIIRRSDFANQITALMADSDLLKQVETGHPETVPVSASGTKGADNVNCNAITNATNRGFCNNWKEMLFLTQLPPPNSITIDSVVMASCNRVLIFAGQKTGVQIRKSTADKSNPANYLESPNLAAFNTPTANSAGFVGSFTFDGKNPGADLMRCLP